MNHRGVFDTGPLPFAARREFGLGGLAAGETERDFELGRGSPDYIRWVQSSLNKILGLRLAVDGISGPATRSAVRTFQSRRGLGVDGIVGPQTERALIASGAGNPPAPPVPAFPLVPLPASPPSIAPTSIAIRAGVVLTTQLEKLVQELDGYFRNAGLAVTLTSGLRSPEDQLRIIRNAAIEHGIHLKYPSIQTATVENVESWLGAWDELRHRVGFEVLPPRSACSRIKPGLCKNPSPHMRGEAFDLAGADLDRIADVVRGYCAQRGGIRQILIERVNGAVHVQTGSGGTCAIETA